MHEVERQFLVTEAPTDLPAPQRLVQGYLSTGHVEVRVRQRDGEHTLTIKVGAGLERTEFERVISAEEFAAMWAHASELRIEKDRYEIALDDGHIAEFDVFRGALAGYHIVEVEFTDADAARAFTPPAWFGDEITEDTRYSNATLASGAWPDDALATP